MTVLFLVIIHITPLTGLKKL